VNGKRYCSLFTVYCSPSTRQLNHKFQLKKSVLVILWVFFLVSSVEASVSVCSWNIQNFGKSKDEKTLAFIATTLQPFDIIAIQEVVAGYGGAQAIALLVDMMNRKGRNWDYTISDQTSGNGQKSERYAFIWNKSKVSKHGNAWLEKKFNREIEREPYMATFLKESKMFTIATFHAITKSDHPETEIKHLKFLPAQYPSLNIIFCGDFNCPQSHTVFNPLKSMGYIPVLRNQKTTLRDKCLRDGCLASEFDNFYFDQKKAKMIEAGVLHFYKTFPSMRDARIVSDHLPVRFVFDVK